MSMHAAQEEKGACMQWRKRNKHACSVGRDISMHVVEEEK